MEKQDVAGLRPGIETRLQVGNADLQQLRRVSDDPDGGDGPVRIPVGPRPPIEILQHPVLIPIAPDPVHGVAPTTGAELGSGDDGSSEYTFPDVSDPNLYWFVPTVSVVAPSAALGVDQSPFSFRFASLGHLEGGATSIQATITATVQVDPLDAARAALPPDATTRAVPLTSMAISIVVPFRDSETGAPTSSSMPATTVSPTTSTPSGDGYTATFVLSGDMARAAYGSLSTAGYQDQSTQLVASYSFDTKQQHSFYRGIPLIPVTNPDDPLGPRSPEPLQVARPAFARSMQLSAVQTSSLLGRDADGIPYRPIDPYPDRGLFFYGWRTVSLNRSSTLSLFVPCRDFGAFYVDITDPAHPHAVGCQDAIALGTASSRLYQILDAHTTDDYTVFVSNGRAGVYLLVPRSYRVGRTVPGSHPGVADYSPAIRWLQALDATHDAQLPCQLQATLVPDLSAAAVVELVATLAAAQNATAPPPTVLLPTSQGSGLATLSPPTWDSAQNIVMTVNDDSLQFLASMAWNDAVIFNANFTAGGSAAELVGNANFILTDGEILPLTRLHVEIDDLAGPWPDGPVVVSAGAADSVTVTNFASGTATLSAVLAASADGTCTTLATGLATAIAPGAQVAVPVAAAPSGATLVADYALSSDAGSIASQRVFLEDLHTTVTFYWRWADTAVTQVDLTVRLDSDTASTSLTMTPPLSTLQLDIVQPLVGDRAQSDNLLHVTAVTHAADGTTSSPVDAVVDLSQGVIVSLNSLLSPGG